MKRSPWVVVGVLLGMVGLGLVCVGIATDHWYVRSIAYPRNVTSPEHVYSMGLWRKCYKVIPKELDHCDLLGGGFRVVDDIDQGDLVGGGHNCIHLKLVKSEEHLLPREERHDLHLARAAAGLTCACATLQLFTMVCVVLGWCPGGCEKRSGSCTMATAAIMSILAMICGMAGGTCFIALRDSEETPSFVTEEYDWSFIVAWCGTGCCLLQAIVYSSIATCNRDDFTKSYSLTI